MCASRFLQVVVALSVTVDTALANPIPIPTVLMPEEFIDASIREQADGFLAVVDGRYPFENLGYKSLRMLYPVAPGASKISVWMDGVPLRWEWSQETYPTILPEWPHLPMIEWTITPVPDAFEIAAHYEHGIVRRPGELAFLYPMGTGKYLDTYAKQTTAHVGIAMPDRYLPKGLFRDDAPVPFRLAAPASRAVTAEIKSRPFEPLKEDLVLTLIDRWAGPLTWFSQPSDMAAGKDLPSAEEIATIVADDFEVPADPVVPPVLAEIRWWGSYPGWEKQVARPTVQRPPPDFFLVRIFDSISEPDPDGGAVSRPGRLSYKERIDRFSQDYFGAVVRETAASPDERNQDPTYAYEHEFEYRALLARPWVPRPGERYWLSLSAGPVPCEWTWGWAESPIHQGKPAMIGRAAADAGWIWESIPSPGPTPIDLAFALTSSDQGPLRYRLLEGSTLTDDCLICGRPTIILPIRGSFWLCPAGGDPLFSQYRVRNLRFHSLELQPEYRGRAKGDYQLGGEVTLLQHVTLAGEINEFEGLHFDSGLVTPEVSFPWIDIELQQIPPTNPLHTFSLHLVAVPWPGVWFSTEHRFHPEFGVPYVSDGDLLSATGGIVRTNRELTARLGIMPVVPDLGLDAVTVTSAGPQTPALSPFEIWFSTEGKAFSENLGPLSDGDLLSDRGAVIRRNVDLVTPFSPMPPAPDEGLDVVTRSPDGLLMFSTEEGFFSESLGVTVGNGDLLTENGQVLRTIAQLMSRFEPIDPIPPDFGLDAVHVWPHGEAWFSTEVSFTDKTLGPVGEGDLLSDTGRIVYRNRELVARFSPLEDLADFGLDAVHLVWPLVPADFDADGDVDLDDLGHLQLCASGPMVPQNQPGCEDGDMDDDGDVDQSDFGILQRCYSGANQPVDPNCVN